MKFTIYQIDAFAREVFQGNPAAVVPLDEWLDDILLQKIAEENNLSETAFFVSAGDHYELRWFTPAEEVDLCGHATLAAAHVLYTHMNVQKEQLKFVTRSGDLMVTKGELGLNMDFPVLVPVAIEPPEKLLQGLGLEPISVLAAFDYVIELANEEQVLNLEPDLSCWNQLDLRGVVVTAPGNNEDFVCRCFFPKLRVNEDPVTGSAHCEIAPYWAKKLGKSHLKAKQVSARSGYIDCVVVDDRIILSGFARDYMRGEITITR